MHRKVLFSFLFVALVSTFVSFPAWAGKVAQRSWNLARDMTVGFKSNPTGYWYFLENGSRDHVPSHYTKFPKYTAAYKITSRKAWYDPTTGSCIAMPSAGTDSIWPANVPVLRPMATSMANEAPFVIVGWKSPIRGKVNISGLLTDIDPSMGNGIKWFIDLGSKTIAQGTIENGGDPQSFQLSSIKVAKGQIVYFIIDANGCYHADDTTLDVIITIASP